MTPSSLLSAALCIATALAEPPVQLNGWFSCPQHSLVPDKTATRQPNFSYYMETANPNIAEEEQTKTSSHRLLTKLHEQNEPMLQDQQAQQHKTQHGRPRHDSTIDIVQYECAKFRMPMCYDDVCESNKTIDLFVKRVVATKNPKGRKEKVLWMVQGGPGSPSSGLENLMNTMFLQLDREVSVYTFDHRGTGRSARLECQAAQAAGLGSPSGLTIEMEEMPACMDEIRFQIDNQTAAFSVTSAAKDLAAIIDFEHRDEDVFVFGLSYGSYLVERLMHFAPVSVRGFVLDGVESHSVMKGSSFVNEDRNAGAVGDRFLAACMADKFCKSKFSDVPNLAAFVHELYDKLDAAVVDGKSGFNACADALSMNDVRPSYLLRYAFSDYLMPGRKRIAIPAVLYRASRCTDQDADALAYFAKVVKRFKDEDASDVTTLLFESIMLYNLIVFSEMWDSPSPDQMTLINWYENATMASGAYLSLPYYCLFTGSREHTCQELTHLPVAQPLVYERDQYWNKTSEVPDGMTALLMTGGMDMQTPRMYGELEYETMTGERLLLNFDNAGHCTTFTTPMNDGGKTCGIRILTSYVKENGVLKYVDTSCMDDLPPLKFLDDAVNAYKVFGTDDLYENW